MGRITLYCLLALGMISLSGCGKKAADENKPISEVKAEAEKMNVNDLKAMAMKYKDAIAAKKADVDKITAKLKEIPLAQMMGEEAKRLNADIAKLSESVTALKERFEIYYNKLKEKGGDVSELQL